MQNMLLLIILPTSLYDLSVYQMHVQLYKLWQLLKRQEQHNEIQVMRKNSWL